MRKLLVTVLIMIATASTYAQMTHFFDLAETGTPHDIQAAIDKGTNANARHKDGQTPLMWAAYDNPNPDVMTVLLKAGADIKARLRSAMTGMDFNAAAQFREALAKLDHEVKAPKVQAVPVGTDKVLRRDELDRILAVATAHDAAFLRFLWRTGTRVSELTGLRLDQCERQGDVVRLRVVGKGTKERFLRIRTKLFDEICATFHGSTYLFETSAGRPFSRCYVSTRIHKLALEAYGRRLGAHSLRHSFATWTFGARTGSRR
jgi:integrase